LVWERYFGGENACTSDIGSSCIDRLM